MSIFGKAADSDNCWLEVLCPIKILCIGLSCLMRFPGRTEAIILVLGPGLGLHAGAALVLTPLRCLQLHDLARGTKPL